MDAPDDDDDDFTALVDADIDQVDGVEKAANGTRILFAKSAQGEPVGLFDAEFVREMVAKGDGDAAPAADPVTVTGSPTAVADMMRRIHAAPVRKAEMSSASINDLPDSAFAYIESGGEKDSEGKTTPRSKRHFPVHDEAHARNALSRAPQSPFGEKAMPKIKAAAKKFGIEVAKAEAEPVARADMFATMADPSPTAVDPGSPSWEGDDASAAASLIERLLALLPDIDALAQREGTEVGAGHLDDLADVCDLQSVRDCVTQAAKTLGGFQVSERAEAGAVAKATTTPAAPDAATITPQESTVTETPAVEATAAAPAAVAKSDAVTPVFSESEMARLYKEAAEKAARKAIKKAAKAAIAHQTTGAATGAPEETRVIPGTDTVQAPAPTQAPAADEVAKAAAAQLSPFAEAMASVAKQFSELATTMGAQSERVEKALAQPDDRRSPMLNGATGEPMLAERGSGPTGDPRFQAVMKAVKEMPDGPEKAQLQRTIALGAIKGTMGHAAEVAARFGG